MVFKKKEVIEGEIKPEQTLEEVRDIKIKEIFTKKAKAQPLNEAEQKIYDDVIKEAMEIKADQELVEAKKKYIEQQEKLKEEVKKIPQDQVLSESAPSISFSKKPSVINEWVAKWFATSRISKGKKKGGTFILKGFRDTGVELVWSPHPVRFVKFTIKNEKGEELEYVTRVVKTKHRWRGTSIPLHIALEGVNENVDLFEGAEVELSAEYVNKALTLQWNAGLMTGLAMRDEQAKDLLAKFSPLIMLIILLLVCIMAYMMYSMYQKIDVLDVNAIKTFIEMAKAQAAANAPVVV